MSAEQAQALVLRTYDFSESSLVVSLFTREFGKVKGLAKGAKRPKNPFDFALDLLSLCRVVFLRKASEALHIITEAKLLRRFRVGDSGLLGYYGALYVVELLNLMTDDEDPQAELFDTTVESLDALQGGLDPALCVTWYELRILELTGHGPSLNSCVACGETLLQDGNDEEKSSAASSDRQAEVYFSLLEGGVLCPRCRPGKRSVVLIPRHILKGLDRLRQTTPGQIAAAEGRPVITGQLRSLLGQYVCHLLGQRPRMHEYLGLSGR